MYYQIDQSGKVEDTKKLTIVAFANGKTRTLKISGKEKRKLIKIMRILYSPRKTFVFKIFAGLIFLLLKDQKIEKIDIDREYPGHEGTIKGFLINLFNKAGKNPPQIEFALIGKESLVHKIAIEAFRGKRKADVIAEAQEVFGLFYTK